MSYANSMSNSIRRHGRSPTSHHGSADQDSSHHHHHHHSHHCDPEWEAKEELRLRELEEARARAAQMEKTMRWWSDCTANWREKWSKVRTERNKAREETRMLRGKLELSSKECNVLKREREELLTQVEKLRKDMTRLSSSIGIDSDRLYDKKPDSSSFSPSCQSSPCLSSERVVAERDIGSVVNDKNSPHDSSQASVATLDPLNNNNQTAEALCESELNTLGHLTLNQDLEFLDKLFGTKALDSVSLTSLSPTVADKRGARSLQRSSNEDCSGPIQELIEQKISMLQLRLDETSKTILAERQEKNKLQNNQEKLQSELSHLRAKYDDLKKTKQDTIKELNQIKAEHQDELDSIRLDLEDEANNRSSLDQRLAELRSELEKLQAENAAEWGRRERLETDKLALERENKKLRTQIEDLEERLERKTKQMTSASDSDVKTLQMELHEKNKELVELKHSHGKVKKLLQDKTTELSHATRRSEQYESEVKKLRVRIDELKNELALAEDEVDNSLNSIRKLQRANDELQEQIEGLQMQIEHLQSRLAGYLEIVDNQANSLASANRESPPLESFTQFQSTPARRSSE